MATICETERLILREFELTDAPLLYLLNADPEVIRFTGDSAFSSVDEATTFLRNYNEYKKYGFGRWAVVLKATNRFIGWCGLKLNEEQLVDIGFRFFRRDWGKGFATESAHAALTYGFNHLGIQQIIARSSTDNLASIRVIEKLGMSFWKYDSCEGIENSAYYRIKLEDYQKHRNKNLKE